MNLLERKELAKLLKAVVTADKTAPYAYSNGTEQFSHEELNDTLRKQFNLLAGSFNDYRRNRLDVYELIEEVINDVLPAKIEARYADFAEVKYIAHGDKQVFKRQLGRRRAKQFITRVGAAGVYEVFKLSSDSYEVQMNTYGGAAQIAFEDLLSGNADFAELIGIVLEGLDDILYKEIAMALNSTINLVPEANKAVSAGLDEQAFNRIIAVTRSYGQPAIYCTYEFARKLVPSRDMVSDRMRDEINTKGYLGLYNGVPVIELPQSFEDESNAVKVMDASFAWILPTGQDNKPVKVVMEGDAHVKEVDNEDWSREFRIYKRMGVGVVSTNHIGIYRDTSLQSSDTMEMFADLAPVKEEETPVVSEGKEGK